MCRSIQVLKLNKSRWIRKGWLKQQQNSINIAYKDTGCEISDIYSCEVVKRRYHPPSQCWLTFISCLVRYMHCYIPTLSESFGGIRQYCDLALLRVLFTATSQKNI